MLPFGLPRIPLPATCATQCRETHGQQSEHANLHGTPYVSDAEPRARASALAVVLVAVVGSCVTWDGQLTTPSRQEVADLRRRTESRGWPGSTGPA